jgi:elongation factor Tu
MTVQDVFTIKGRGTVITGKVENGMLAVGDEIHLKRQGSDKKTVVTGIEMFRKVITQAQVGDDVGVLLKDISKQDVQRGDVLTGSDTEFNRNA